MANTVKCFAALLRLVYDRNDIVEIDLKDGINKGSSIPPIDIGALGKTPEGMAVLKNTVSNTKLQQESSLKAEKEKLEVLINANPGISPSRYCDHKIRDEFSSSGETAFHCLVCDYKSSLWQRLLTKNSVRRVPNPIAFGDPEIMASRIAEQMHEELSWEKSTKAALESMMNIDDQQYKILYERFKKISEEKSQREEERQLALKSLRRGKYTLWHNMFIGYTQVLQTTDISLLITHLEKIADQLEMATMDDDYTLELPGGEQLWQTQIAAWLTRADYK